MDRKDAVPEEFCIHQFGLMPETTQKCDVTCEVQVCKFSEWSEFSACPRHCGGYRVRNRTMEGILFWLCPLLVAKIAQTCFIVVFIFWGHKSFFYGATDTPVLDFWWRLLWVSKPKWAALFVLGRGVYVTYSLRLTSGATPADLLLASMVAKSFSSMCLHGGAQNHDLSCHRSETRQMLYRLSYASSALENNL